MREDSAPLPMVDVLLATYNGARFLKAQLDSIVGQTENRWRIIAHDDGSTDDTPRLLADAATALGDRFLLIDDGIRRGSAQQNFAFLSTRATAPYIAFCDQDDIWYPRKLELSLEEMQSTEADYPGRAVLVHSDLEVVDEQLQRIAPSFLSYQRIIRHATGRDLLAQNNVTGCTMLLNRAALSAGQPIADEALMHDWWFALRVAVTGGVIRLVDEPLVRYRQHRQNTLGARRYTLAHQLETLTRLPSAFADSRAAYAQARAAVPGTGLPQFLVAKLTAKYRRFRATPARS